MQKSQNFPASDLQLLLDKYRSFVKAHLFPIDLEVVIGPFKKYLPVLSELRQKAKSEGLFAPHLSREEGGLGLTLVQFAQISEILEQSPLGHYVFNSCCRSCRKKSP